MQPLHSLHIRHISIYSMLKILYAFKLCCDTSLMTVNFPELCVVLTYVCTCTYVCMYVCMCDNMCIAYKYE